MRPKLFQDRSAMTPSSERAIDVDAVRLDIQSLQDRLQQNRHMFVASHAVDMYLERQALEF